MMKKTHLCWPLAVLVPAVVLATAPALAQNSRYSGGWATPDAAPAAAGKQDETLQRMVDELNKMVGEAERGRAADPRFLSDLRDLARRYAWPWRRRILIDDFRDGDFTRDPRWTVESGSFSVGYEGLASRQEAAAAPAPAPAPAQPAEPSRQQEGSRDLGRALLGTLLQELARPGEGGTTQQAPAATPAAPVAPTESRIRLDTAIPNAFALQLTLRSQAAAGGRLEIGVGQGERAVGYRLVYSPGGAPSLALVRVGAYGAAVVDGVNERVSLEDNAPHVLQLTRDAQGEMVISLDGKERLRVRERAFRDAFDRLVLVNRGGDYDIRQVAVYGAP